MDYWSVYGFAGSRLGRVFVPVAEWDLGGRKGGEWVSCVAGCLTRARTNISFRFLCCLCAVMGVCEEIHCNSGSECNSRQCLCSVCV